MNRKLKFRVWDKIVHHFINPKDTSLSEKEGLGNSGELLIDFYGKLRIAIFSCGNGDNSADSVFDVLDGDRFIIQQWTGLKSQDGLDIYEGDIVRGFNSKCIYEVIWDEYEISHAQYVGFKLKTYRLDGTSMLSSLGTPIVQTLNIHTHFDIIGNIFETPELCKPTNS